MAEKFSVKTQSIRFRQRLSLWESWHRAAMNERANLRCNNKKAARNSRQRKNTKGKTR